MHHINALNVPFYLFCKGCGEEDVSKDEIVR